MTTTVIEGNDDTLGSVIATTVWKRKENTVDAYE